MTGHEITVEQACAALDVTPATLAKFLRNSVDQRLSDLGEAVRYRTLTDLEHELAAFDERVTGARRLLESAIAADQAGNAAT